MVPALLAAALAGGFPELPPLPEIKRAPQVTYLDRAGEVIGVRGGNAAPPVDLERLPSYVPAAFVSIEDRRFYEHPGFDAIGIARALMTDVTKGRAAQGASTITQQLARNLFLTNNQTMERKAQELLLAVQLEQKYSKQQILALYLSRVYFGQGAWGLEAASRRYFDKPASRLTIREAATLAGCLKSPSGYNPVDQPERSAERVKLVLAAMVETGAITPAQKAKALAKPLKLKRAEAQAAAQYFVDWVDLQVRRLVVGPIREDLVVETTLDATLEADAAASTRTMLARNAKLGVEQAALVALDGEGRVRAMVGGADYAQSQFNRATQAKRQAGSAWKPFVYLTAMEAGRTPDTPVVDEPVTINGWSPRNHTDGFLGPITLQVALAQSVNTVAARLADEVGRDRVAATARRLGITTPISPDPAMALGTSGVIPLDMATAYDAFANGGVRVQAFGLEGIRNLKGAVIWRRPPPPHPQAIGNPPLAEMDAMMRTVLTQGTGVRAAIPRYDLAGKTGTTSDSKDAWFCGFTGGLTTVVWVGRDDAKPMRNVAGGGAPAELWRGFMVAALPRVGAHPIPAGPAPSFAPPVAVPPPQDPVDALLSGGARSDAPANTTDAPPPPPPPAPPN